MWSRSNGLSGKPKNCSYGAVFAFGLVAFGFLGMGPVTIAVDSYGPVTDNAQSVYELSTIEQLPGIEAEVKRDFGFAVDFTTAKELLEENDGAGNTFKATAKPVLIGTAVVGATTMIFSIIVLLTAILLQQRRTGSELRHAADGISLARVARLVRLGLPAALEVLQPDCFYKTAHRWIFQAALQLFERGEAVGVPVLTPRVDMEEQERLLVEDAAAGARLQRVIP